MIKELVQSKPCAHCGEMKNFTEYHRRGQGQASWCKICANAGAVISKRRRTKEKEGIKVVTIRRPEPGEVITKNKKYNFTEVICKKNTFTNFI